MLSSDGSEKESKERRQKKEIASLQQYPSERRGIDFINEMKIHLKNTNLDITPALSVYFEKKINSLERFLKHWSKDGEVEVWAELARSTKHHHSGEVFRAEFDIRLPGKILRVEAKAEDIRRAIDLTRAKMLREIGKYKTAKSVKSRGLKLRS